MKYSFSRYYGFFGTLCYNWDFDFPASDRELTVAYDSFKSQYNYQTINI